MSQLLDKDTYRGLWAPSICAWAYDEPGACQRDRTERE